MWALIVVPNDFPNNDAGAVRDEAFAQIYRKLGYDVFLIGRGTNNKFGKYNEIYYFSVNLNKQGFVGKTYGYFARAIKCKRKIDELIVKYGYPDLIHINHVSEGITNYLIDIAKKENIPIVHDSVEWYSSTEFKLGVFDKSYILKDRLNRRIIRDPIRVYAISSYLENHFSEKGLRTCRIPVIMDVKDCLALELCDQNKNNDKINLVYAGSPGKKDYLFEMIRAFDMLEEKERERFVFNIYGISEEQIKKVLGVSCMHSCINAYGRVCRDVVKDALICADFAVLLRPEKERYAMAGFPTKTVEAMSFETAMICNVTSDLGMYLIHKKNSIICNSHESKDFCVSLREVLSLDRDRIETIKKNARLTSEKYFDYRNYVKNVKEFIK